MQPAKKEMLNEVSKIQAQLKSYESLKIAKDLTKRLALFEQELTTGPKTRPTAQLRKDFAIIKEDLQIESLFYEILSKISFDDSMINNRPLKGLLCKLENMLDAETPQHLKGQIRQELEALSGIVLDNTLHKYSGHERSLNDRALGRLQEDLSELTGLLNTEKNGRPEKKQLFNTITYLKKLRDIPDDATYGPALVEFALDRLSKDVSFSVEDFYSKASTDDLDTETRTALQSFSERAETRQLGVINSAIIAHSSSAVETKMDDKELKEKKRQEEKENLWKALDETTNEELRKYKDHRKYTFPQMINDLMKERTTNPENFLAPTDERCKTLHGAKISFDTYRNWIGDPKRTGHYNNRHIRPSLQKLIVFLFITDAIKKNDLRLRRVIHTGGYNLSPQFDFDIVVLTFFDYPWKTLKHLQPTCRLFNEALELLKVDRLYHLK